MATDPISAVVKRLDLGLHSRGVCTACLGFVAVALDMSEEREVRREVAQAASLMWDEGLDATVRAALRKAARAGAVDACRELRELDVRGPRSAVFRAVVRLLAEELREEVRRREAASRN